MFTILIIAITVTISFACFKRPHLFDNFVFSPFRVVSQKQYYRIFSHAFVHADSQHLLFNMITLYFFGTFSESAYGYILFILIYFGGIVFSTLPAFLKHRNNSNYSSVGASGGTSAILFSYVLIQPLGRIYIFFIPVGIPAFIFGIVFLVYSFYMSKKGSDLIAHDAHFAGAIFGFLLPLLFYPMLIIRFLNELNFL